MPYTPVFKHFILNAIILQSTTEMFNSPQTPVFAQTKQKPSMKLKFSKSHLQIPIIFIGKL